jgi:AsmA protein
MPRIEKMMESQESIDEQLALERHKRRGRRLLSATVLIVVLLVLSLTPPFLNVSSFRRRIVTSMSQSLGRPVHLDNVSLHLLPMPGFTLQNLVVSEDPAFGNEPIIRANTVTATLRVSSLWKRRVEFSTVSFTDPSVNLVRNPDGHWNLEGVLVHASRVDTAPTAQQKAGPTPRFPYIEATGGRINLKLGNEKTPFALTDADFALWLPSPQVWRIRLVGKPARTDTNIGDPGTVRLEGSLQRSQPMANVPVNLQASWHDAPLGEASKLLTGDDRGWRGTLHADASLDGTLGAAALKLHVTADDLRRADFVPAQTLDVSARCTSTADVPAAILYELACAVPNSGAEPVMVQSPSVDLSRPAHAAAVVQAQQLPLEWVFGWMRLFSARIPAEPSVPGTADVTVTHAEGDTAAQWNGIFSVTMAVEMRKANGALLPAKGDTNTTKQTFEASLTTTGAGSVGKWELSLPPTPLRIGPGAEIVIGGQASAEGYGFSVAGQASPAQFAVIAHALPQLADGTELLLPKNSPAADALRPVGVSCSRSWTSGQSCTTPVPARRPVVQPKRRRH